ncbi:MAG: hypothetical protein RLZZ29_1427, partial [Cyanobacteriota bacterium]
RVGNFQFLKEILRIMNYNYRYAAIYQKSVPEEDLILILV